MKKLLSLILCGCLLFCAVAFVSCGGTSGPDTTPGGTSGGTDTTPAPTGPDTTLPDSDPKAELRESLKKEFLKLAEAVTVDGDSVTFADASCKEGETITVKKNPKKVVNLYASFTTLWYEAGGKVMGCIGGTSASELYLEYIGRDITADEGMTVVAQTASGKNWDMEAILLMEPDLIICSTSMSGYATVKAPAASANIPVIAVSYDDFADYLKWFKVFCNLTGNEDKWESVALKALDEVLDVLCEIPEGNSLKVFSMFADSKGLKANTSNTVVGGMVTAMKAQNIVDLWENASGATRLDINLETVFAADPDIIIVQCHASAEDARAQVEELYGDSQVWQSLSAVKNGKVFYLEKTLFHNKPNSRFAEAYQKLAVLLYPDVTFSFQKEQ